MKASPPGVCAKILLIDDDAPFRQFVTTFLTSQGYEVLTAASGAEGLACAAEQNPELVLCDVEMPGLNGHEVLVSLRRTPALAEIPVLFLTGRDSPSDIRAGMNLGADDYLTKPFKSLDLLNAIRVRLERRRAAQERMEQQLRRALQPLLDKARPLNESLEQVLVLKTTKESRLVKVGDIRKIVADGEYTWVYWDKEQRTMLRKPLKQWLAELPAEQFLQVHRGAIINLAWLERTEKTPDGRMQLFLREEPTPLLASLRLTPKLNQKLQALG